MSDARNQQHLRLVEAFASFHPSKSASYTSLSTILDNVSGVLASDRNLRVHLGIKEPPIWPPLIQAWSDVVHAQSFAETEDPQSDGAGLRALILSLGRLTRNVAAGVPHNQRNAFPAEPHIRQLIRHYTSWTLEREETSFPINRILIQAISNIVTSNDDLQSQLWQAYMALPEERSILIAERAGAFGTTTAGARLCIPLLDHLEIFLDSPEATEEAKVFEVGQDELISPPQTTLLKLLDAYLLSHREADKDTCRSEVSAQHAELTAMLASLFFSLSAYAQNAICQALGGDQWRPHEKHADAPPPSPPAPSSSSLPPGGTLDLQLPGVCAALVLVAQCLMTILLIGSKHPLAPSTPSPKEYLAGCRGSDDGGGIIEHLIEDLRLLDAFLPRIAFGKVAGAPSPFPSPSPSSPPPTTLGATAHAKGFAYLKRDLVRLLGILCHDDRAAQDRVRLCEGITVVMNLCVIDERNPYLREHAIFTLRNLLHNNPENQAVVDAIQQVDATGNVDATGSVRG
ncbi:hypothetical protein EW146_g6774 [Bondarzewia mesenterica]|uniref:Ataxin-10 homolog n=1 Tax=Bondarzewia mesenterica TaxID=1095465 RepID=A0A4S4LPF9_9AGAM|nr:hypothetical protein EW146_g6774 [Bondarzewia mesenterica]